MVWSDFLVSWIASALVGAAVDMGFRKRNQIKGLIPDYGVVVLASVVTFAAVMVARSS